MGLDVHKHLKIMFLLHREQMVPPLKHVEQNEEFHDVQAGDT
jgi:hypothetical protein